jgi:hypothetical protein
VGAHSSRTLLADVQSLVVAVTSALRAKAATRSLKLSDAGHGASRIAAIGRHPKLSTKGEILAAGRHCPARRLNDPPHITLTIDGSADGRVLITTLQVDRANPVTGASRRIYKFTGQLCLILARPFARKFHDPLIRLVATLSNKHDLSGLTFDT